MWFKKENDVAPQAEELPGTHNKDATEKNESEPSEHHDEVTLILPESDSVEENSVESDVSTTPSISDTDTKISTGAETQDLPIPAETFVETETTTGAFCSERDNELKSLMEKLLAEFSGKLKYDAKKQEQIDQLYRENMAFRDGLVEQCKKKLMLAVIEQIDDAEKQVAHFQNVEFSEDNFRKIVHSFEDIAVGFRDMLLERFDIESWQSEPDTSFDPKRQRTLRTTPTSEAERVKTIRRGIRFGYQTADGQILRPEMVDVYVFDASAEKSGTTPSPEMTPNE